MDGIGTYQVCAFAQVKNHIALLDLRPRHAVDGPSQCQCASDDLPKRGQCGEGAGVSSLYRHFCPTRPGPWTLDHDRAVEGGP